MQQMKPEYAGEEIVLLINNDQPLYNQKIYMFENLVKKVKKGTYDRIKALKLFSYLTDKVRIDWNKKYSADQEEYMTIAGSRQADKELREEFEEDYLRNEKKLTIKGTAYTGKY